MWSADDGDDYHDNDDDDVDDDDNDDDDDDDEDYDEDDAIGMKIPLHFWTKIKRELSACYFLPYVSTKTQLLLYLIG